MAHMMGIRAVGHSRLERPIIIQPKIISFSPLT